MVNECTLFSKNVTTKIYLDSENIVSKHFYSFLHSFLFKLQLVYFLVVYRFQKVSAKSVWKVSGTRPFGSFQRKTSGSNATEHLKRWSCFSGWTKRKLMFHFFKDIFIPVSRLRGLFSVNEGKRVSGTKLTSPEFCLPFVQTVNRPVCPCKW